MSDQANDLADAGLTAEELEALNYVEPAEDVNPDADATAVADETETPAPAADPAADPAVATPEPDAPAAAADAPAVDASAAPAQAKAAPEPKAETAPAPILIVEAPADAQEKLAKIATDKAALLDQYESGEITAKELHTKTDALNEQAFDIKTQVREAELAQRMEAQRAQNDWDATCRSFLDTHPEYHDAAGKERFQALDEAIKAMARMPINKGISGDKLIQKAHNMVKAAYGEAVETTAPAVSAKTAQPVVPKPAIPPTNIGKLPAADANDTSGGEFAALDALAKGNDVEAYENALAKLPDSQRNRYMAR